MARSSGSPRAYDGARPGAERRSGALLFALLVTTLVLLALQFALAGSGAFTLDKSPTTSAAHAFGVHAILGLVIGLLALLILVAVLASRPARAHRGTLWLAVTLAVLSVGLQPVLGTAGTRVPVVGALHGLNTVAIFTLAGWLTWATARRRAAANQPNATTSSAAGARANPR